jgi:glutathione S-transferase
MKEGLEITWGSGSPNAWRVLLAAEVKKIPYTSKLIEFSGDDLKKPDFLAINPRGKVPAIRDGNCSLYESLAIMAYLERRNPKPAIFGNTPAETGLIWRVISEFECYMKPAWETMLTPVIFRQIAEKKDQMRTAAETVHKELARLEKAIDPDEWLAGGAISAADCAVYPFIKFMVRVAQKDEVQPLGLGLHPFGDRYPGIEAWMKRVESLPGYARTYPPHWK